MTKLIVSTPRGLYCSPGDFYVDPWRPVENAVITHAHSDHLRPGSTKYLLAQPNRNIIRTKLGENINAQFVEYGQKIKVKDVELSLHPAGHILGSAQIRINYNGEICVVSGDYKTEADKTCEALEPLKCHTFVTESTFALPIYRWQVIDNVFFEINQWWEDCKAEGMAGVLFCYALGKAQRILSGINETIGPIYTHGAVENITRNYREYGIQLPQTQHVGSLPSSTKFSGSLILAPPSALGSQWLKQFGTYSSGFASGWMRIRGARRRKSVDRGFVLSDHADWNGLLSTISQTEAQEVIVTHGNAPTMVRWLKEKGIKAQSFKTEFEGEAD